MQTRCIEKKRNLIQSFETADLLYSPQWPGRRFTGCIAPWEDSGPEIFLVLYSSPLFLGGEQPHFVQRLLPLIWNDLALFVFRTYFEQVQNRFAKFKIIMTGKNAVK